MRKGKKKKYNKREREKKKEIAKDERKDIAVTRSSGINFHGSGRYR